VHSLSCFLEDYAADDCCFATAGLGVQCENSAELGLHTETSGPTPLLCRVDMEARCFGALLCLDDCCGRASWLLAPEPTHTVQHPCPFAFVKSKCDIEQGRLWVVAKPEDEP
jgi:hypothetical protein